MGIFETLKERISRSSGFYYKREGKLNFLDYKSAFELAEKVSGGLKKKGVRKDSKVGLLLPNCPEWAIIDLACISMGAVVVPLNSSMSDDEIDFIAKDSGIDFIFSNKKIQFAGMKSYEIPLLGKLENNLGEFIFNVKEESETVKDGDIATICYTSGTTGNPKGVILTHENILFNVKNQPLSFSESDIVISYLPLSHMFERTCGYYTALYNNVNICYGGGIKSIAGDIREFKPTCLLAVPLVLEKISFGVKNNFITKALLKAKQHNLVGKIIKRKLGGKFKFFICGGAALCEDTKNFFNMVGINVYEGYGLTETSPLISVNSPEFQLEGSVGRPLNGLKVKISKKGTLLVNGPGLFYDYTQKGEKEKRIVDGWFDTGDLASIKKGYIFIHGRSDDLIVLSSGKKIYPHVIESKLENAGIEQAFVYGTNKPHLTALVYSKKSAKAVRLAIHEVNKKLSKHFVVKKFYVLKEPFSTENKMLTSTHKKARKNIMQNYQGIIGGMYGE